jgi:hypothetical protein
MQKQVLIPGGRGGRGNTSFKSSQNKAPVIAENGEEGREMWIELELKVRDPYSWSSSVCFVAGLGKSRGPFSRSSVVSLVACMRKVFFWGRKVPRNEVQVIRSNGQEGREMWKVEELKLCALWTCAYSLFSASSFCRLRSSLAFWGADRQ